MKTMNLSILAAALTLSLSTSHAFAVDPNVSEEEIQADHVFAPKGFDNNDSSEIVVTGLLRNLCYKAPKATATVVGNQILVRVTALHIRAPGGYCAQMAVPFQEVIRLGVLTAANYQVVVTSQAPATPLETNLGVMEASTSSIDDFVYANVDWIETFKDSRRAVLHGYNPSDCFELDGIQLVSNAKDAYSVLPIMKQVRTTCPLKMVPFAYEFQVPAELTASEILLHTRVLDGKSVNKIFFNVVAP